MAKRTYIEPMWHVQIAALVALGLQLLLPSNLVFGPRWVVPALEGLLLIGLTMTTPREYARQSNKRKVAAIAMILLVSVANAASLVLLVKYLTAGGKADGQQLLLAALNIFLTNIIAFGLLYWELDSGGPTKRHTKDMELPDFLFPQYNSKELAPAQWIPTFVDYLYVSATNATAFSPTDTLPLTHRAKLLMLAQALVSLITVALVTARAVNIIN